MRIALIVGALALAAASSASAMPVSTFLGKAQSLKKKGPLALFSGDLKLLMNQVKADSATLRAENQALTTAGKPKHYCTPADFQMDENEILKAMEAVPQDRRAATTTKVALRDHLARRFPCRG